MTAGKTIAAVLLPPLAGCPRAYARLGYDFAPLPDRQRRVPMVQLDCGEDVFTLVRISHIHLFGLTFILFIMGSIVVPARVRPNRLKAAIRVTPFLMILVDILSWHITRVYRPFAWITWLSGIAMGLAFAARWVTSACRLWFGKADASAG